MTDYRIGLGNTNADELQGVGISPTPPTNNQGLVYNSTTGLWTPSSVIASVTAPEIEATFTAANQIYKGTGAGAGALQDFDTVLNSQFGAAGQLFAGTGAGTGEKLGIGTAGQRLTVGGADPSGLEWSNPVNPALQYEDLLGWTSDGADADQGYQLGAAATIYLGRVPLPNPLTITNVISWIAGIAGVALTHCFMALYNSAGTIIGQTADQSAVWVNAYTKNVLPLVGGPFVCTPLAGNDFVWLATYVGTAVTLPAFFGAGGAPPAYGLTTAARSRYGQIAQANTATLGNIIPANISAPPTIPWMAIS